MIASTTTTKRKCIVYTAFLPRDAIWQYSDENSPNGGVECRWGRQKWWAAECFWRETMTKCMARSHNPEDNRAAFNCTRRCMIWSWNNNNKRLGSRYYIVEATDGHKASRGLSATAELLVSRCGFEWIIGLSQTVFRLFMCSTVVRLAGVTDSRVTVTCWNVT